MTSATTTDQLAYNSIVTFEGVLILHENAFIYENNFILTE